MLSEKHYLIWEVIHLFLHVFSRPEGFCLTRAILAHFKILSCHTKQGVNLLDLKGFALNVD